MPIIELRDLDGADRHLRAFARQLIDLRPFWRELAERLADDVQSRWPLQRRSGRLRTSLTWRGTRLGRHGVFESSQNQLRFGTDLFYSRFPQFGTTRQSKTPLIDIDEEDASAQLQRWVRDRATSAGLEVT